MIHWLIVISSIYCVTPCSYLKRSVEVTEVNLPFLPQKGTAITNTAKAIYFFGQDAQGNNTVVWKLSPDTLQWTAVESLLISTDNRFFTHAVVGRSNDQHREFIYIIGKTGDGDASQMTIETFDIKAQQWLPREMNPLSNIQSQKSPLMIYDSTVLPVTTSRKSNEKFSSYFWVVGSYPSFNAFETQCVLEYSTSHSPMIYVKQNITNLPREEIGPIAGQRALLCPNKLHLYISGGEAASNSTNNSKCSSVNAFSFKEKKWHKLPNMQTARSHHVAFYISYHIKCCLSGSNITMSIHASSAAYSRLTRIWLLRSLRCNIERVKRSEFILIMGGKDTNGLSITLAEILDLSQLSKGWKIIDLRNDAHAYDIYSTILTHLMDFFHSHEKFAELDNMVHIFFRENITQIREIVRALISSQKSSVFFLGEHNDSFRENTECVDVLIAYNAISDVMNKILHVSVSWSGPKWKQTLLNIWKFMLSVTNVPKYPTVTAFIGILSIFLYIIYFQKITVRVALSEKENSVFNGEHRLKQYERSYFAAFTGSILTGEGTNRFTKSIESDENSHVSTTSLLANSLEDDIRKEADSIRYTRADMIAKGAYGTIYKAIREDTGGVVALKVIQMIDQQTHINDQRQAQQNAQLAREVNLMRSMISHTNLISYFGCNFDSDKNELVIAMEYAEGGSVGALCRRLSPTSLSRTTIQKYTKQMCFALQHLHAHEILHRDLKGDNVLISKEGKIKLADFGTAKKISSSRSKKMSDAEKSHGKSRHKSIHYNITGTPLYMAPEAFVDEAAHEMEFFVTKPNVCVSYKSDIWSLGCTVVEMINGGYPPWPPHRFSSLQSFIKTVRESDELPLNNINAKELDPVLLDFLINRCLVRDPSKRADIQDLLVHPFLN